MYFRYYSKYDSNRETINLFRAVDLDAAWKHLSASKRLSVDVLRDLYIIEYATVS
jgi:hypothetical protein